jgi:hypothetical protein
MRKFEFKESIYHKITNRERSGKMDRFSREDF